MSDITKERWEFNRRTGIVTNAEGLSMADAFHPGTGEAIAVLPEALALLERMRVNRSITVQEQIEAEAEVLLRRAGVLK